VKCSRCQIPGHKAVHTNVPGSLHREKLSFTLQQNVTTFLLTLILTQLLSWMEKQIWDKLSKKVLDTLLVFFVYPSLTLYVMDEQICCIIKYSLVLVRQHQMRTCRYLPRPLFCLLMSLQYNYALKINSICLTPTGKET